jgi:hypothetical protein
MDLTSIPRAFVRHDEAQDLIEYARLVGGCVPHSVEKRLGVALVPAINYSTVRFQATA